MKTSVVTLKVLRYLLCPVNKHNGIIQLCKIPLCKIPDMEPTDLPVGVRTQKPTDLPVGAET